MKRFYKVSLLVCADIYIYKNIFDMFRKNKEFECREEVLSYTQIYYCDDIKDAIEKHRIQLGKEGIDKLACYAQSDLIRKFDAETTIFKCLSSECKNISYEIVADETNSLCNKSLKRVMIELTADDFLSYCKDRLYPLDEIIGKANAENNL